jgi:hypothetical protein
MSFQSLYRPLFQIKFRHAYHLNEGTSVFNENLNQDWMATNLNAFDIQTILSIEPSEHTVQLLRNMRARYTLTRDAIIVLVRTDNVDENLPFIEFDPTTHFDFLIGIRDPYFENYTDIELDRSKLMLISNLEPEEAEEPVEPEDPTAYPLPKPVEVSYHALSEFGSGGSDLTIHLYDTLTQNELVGKIAVLRICLTNDDGELMLTNEAGDEFAENLPEATLSFANRSTYWKYIDTSDGSEIFTTNTEKPLTKFGYVTITHSGDEYPNPNANLIIKDKDSGDLFSEVFI